MMKLEGVWGAEVLIKAQGAGYGLEEAIGAGVCKENK